MKWPWLLMLSPENVGGSRADDPKSYSPELCLRSPEENFVYEQV